MAAWANPQQLLRTLVAILCVLVLAVTPLSCSASAPRAGSHTRLQSVEQQCHPCCPPTNSNTAQLLCCTAPLGDAPAHPATAPHLSLGGPSMLRSEALLYTGGFTDVRLTQAAPPYAPPRLTLRI